jgi:peptide deformylase
MDCTLFSFTRRVPDTQNMEQQLKIVLWPDPRLKKISATVTVFDETLVKLAAQMFEIMRESKGVGLAAPQVGRNIRLFVMNHDGDPAHDRVYVNPLLSDAEDEEEDEEGCLSLPKVNINVYRNMKIRINAQDVTGQPFEQVESGYLARIWQHETDHLNGIMLTDRMGPVAKMTYRKILRDLEDRYLEQNPPPKNASKKKSR